MHELYDVTSVEALDGHRLWLQFDDGLERVVDLSRALTGELFAPLQDPDMFRRVTIDPDTRTVVWPNGADFDSETLHNWPRYEAALAATSAVWRAQPQSSDLRTSHGQPTNEGV